MAKLSDSVKNLRGIGKKTLQKLERLEIEMLEDLINHYPRKYNDYSNIVKIKNLKLGPVTVKGQITSVNGRWAKRRKLHITEAVIEDDTGAVKATWFNQPYLKKQLSQNEEVYASGELSFKNQFLTLEHPAIEPVGTFQKDTARIVPVYPETKGLSSKQLRKYIKQAFDAVGVIPETLPEAVVSDSNLISYSQALKNIHFPESKKQLEASRYSLGFRELFELMVASIAIKNEVKGYTAPLIQFNEAVAKDFTQSLPFELTDAQRKVAWQILQDIDAEEPMNRLLEGDVGSGKTVVAALAAVMAAENGLQTSLMAPTSVLARQHYETFSTLPINLEFAILTGSMKASEKKSTLEKIKNGSIDVVIGTHALLEDISFNSLGLVVIDEQHRFGVKQRNKLRNQNNQVPHMLSMTATPIPRSLALTIYGEMDLSIIDEMPQGRKPIETKVVDNNQRGYIYKEIDQEIDKGNQAFVICPLISDSDSLGVKSVESEYERLNAQVLKHRSIGLLHGGLNKDEKSKVMEKFHNGELDVLVSTTVVEVGVDVPNATIMLIEGGERFGLAQLHQLRGRIGRSDKPSKCFVITSGDAIPKRLRVFEQTQDGFELAEYDLQLRGPGEVYGVRQHGLLDLRMAKLTDSKLIANVRTAAKKFMDNPDNLLQYERLNERVQRIKTLTKLN